MCLFPQFIAASVRGAVELTATLEEMLPIRRLYRVRLTACRCGAPICYTKDVFPIFSKTCLWYTKLKTVDEIPKYCFFPPHSATTGAPTLRYTVLIVMSGALYRGVVCSVDTMRPRVACVFQGAGNNRKESLNMLRVGALVFGHQLHLRLSPFFLSGMPVP